MTTEETVGKTVKVWDLSDRDNPTLVGDCLGESELAHNVQIDGRYAFVSHYSSGVYVLGHLRHRQPRRGGARRHPP